MVPKNFTKGHARWKYVKGKKNLSEAPYSPIKYEYKNKGSKRNWYSLILGRKTA